MNDYNLSMADALFTKTRQRVLGLLYGKSDQSYYRNELMRLSGIGRGTIMRELDRLVDAEIITETKQGNQLHYQANPACPVFDELKSIVKKTVGIVDVLLSALEPFAHKIELAFVYGSVAKGEEHAASDIDLMLVVQDIGYAEVIENVLPIAEQLSRDINPSIYSPDEFSEKIQAEQSFITRVLDQDKIWLFGEQKLANFL